MLQTGSCSFSLLQTPSNIPGNSYSSSRLLARRSGVANAANATHPIQHLQSGKKKTTFLEMQTSGCCGMLRRSGSFPTGSLPSNPPMDFHQRGYDDGSIFTAAPERDTGTPLLLCALS